MRLGNELIPTSFQVKKCLNVYIYSKHVVRLTCSLGGFYHNISWKDKTLHCYENLKQGIIAGLKPDKYIKYIATLGQKAGADFYI